MKLIDEDVDFSERRVLIRQFLIMGGIALIVLGTILVAAGLLLHWIFVA